MLVWVLLTSFFISVAVAVYAVDKHERSEAAKHQKYTRETDEMGVTRYEVYHVPAVAQVVEKPADGWRTMCLFFGWLSMVGGVIGMAQWPWQVYRWVPALSGLVWGLLWFAVAEALKRGRHNGRV